MEQFSQCPIAVYTKIQLGQVVAQQLLKYHKAQHAYSDLWLLNKQKGHRLMSESFSKANPATNQIIKEHC